MDAFWRLQDDISGFPERRERMVQDQLAAHGICDQRVLGAMNRVPREEFVPPQLQCEAYADWPLPIGYGQTISQPFTVAYMTEALLLAGGEKVLEVGTGSGYGAAVLACLADEVHTIERIPALAKQARKRLKRLGFHNVHVHTADGTLGLPIAAPFDAMVVTAGGDRLPENYCHQLVDGGRLVIPIGETTRHQLMHRFTRRGDRWSDENLGRFAFVPLIGKHGWHHGS